VNLKPRREKRPKSVKHSPSSAAEAEMAWSQLAFGAVKAQFKEPYSVSDPRLSVNAAALAV
jgi:hypothetical protein